ncbi:hypothetical protein OC844_004670 [Tilletia horrida]|nr:hypothetical protein OC844_004670 [Tilletia horrida]
MCRSIIAWFLCKECGERPRAHSIVPIYCPNAIRCQGSFVEHRELIADSICDDCKERTGRTDGDKDDVAESCLSMSVLSERGSTGSGNSRG